MTKYLLFTLLLSTYIGVSQNLKLASDVWPPFTNVENEKSVATDLVTEALKRNEVSTQLTILGFEDVMSGIDNKTFDGSAALWKTKEREESLLFSKPYLQNQLVLVALKGTDTEKYSIAELGNAKIGLVSNYAYSEELMEAQKVEKVFSKSDQDNLEKLIDEKIDYMLVDALLIQYLMKFQMNDVEEMLSVGSRPFLVEPLYFAIRKDVPNAEKIISEFNTSINKMIVDGTYHEILELNWVEADVDGDGVTELILDGDAAGEQPPQESYSLFEDLNNVELEEEESRESRAYYINGKMYQDWASVPDMYKKNGKLQYSDTENKGGFTLRL